MRHLPYLLLITCATSAQTFRLESERRETYGFSGKSEVFTAYEYDSDGKRTAKRAFEGSGTGGPALGTTAYSYDSGGRLLREVTTTGLDTVTDAGFEYGLGPMPIKITVRGAGGKLRYTDNFVYDGAGKLIAEGRLNPSGASLFERRYGYDDALRLIADTLFENEGTTPKATQVRALSYNGDGTVSGEAHSRFSDGDWFVWKELVMSYAGGKLAAMAAFEGAQRTDSLAIKHDAFGNRSEEKHFDEDGTLVDALFFTWKAIPITFVWRSAAKRRAPAAFTLDGSRFDLRGRLLVVVPNTLSIRVKEKK